MVDINKNQGFLGKILNSPNDNPTKTILVAIILCLVCSVLVSTSAVMFKPQQKINKEADIRKNILAVTGLLTDENSNINDLFKQFEVKIIDLDTGDYADIDTTHYDQRKAAKDPSQSIKLSKKEDIAKISRRAKFAPVYILKDGDTIKQIVLPVHGYGLWSTLYGFLALEGDFNTIGGLRFYEQGETPGLGGEVDNPKWRNQWHGKKVFDENGKVQIKVIHGHVNDKVAGSEYQVDGISGATLTSKGVSNLLNYWLGKHGFGPYLKKMRSTLRKS